MTLHDAICNLLKTKGPLTTQQIAERLNKNRRYQQRNGSRVTAFQIHGRVKNYPTLFKKVNDLVALANDAVVHQHIHLPVNGKLKHVNRQTAVPYKDEHYVLDLCDSLLGLKGNRQHRFSFLRGDINEKGKSASLPVDAYYAELNLVVEYREIQHTGSVSFFDKVDKMTVSRVHRGEQRKRYDERRRQVLPKHGIKLIEISYSNFSFNSYNRIIRNPEKDKIIIREKLRIVIPVDD